MWTSTPVAGWVSSLGGNLAFRMFKCSGVISSWQRQQWSTAVFAALEVYLSRMPQSLELACKLSHRLDQFQPKFTLFSVMIYTTHQMVTQHLMELVSVITILKRADAKQLRR